MLPYLAKLSKKEFLVIILILLISLFFRFYHLEENFPFSWDQERDAFAVWRIVKEGHLTLIGPSAAGFDTFYLGPLWYYLLAPFYLFFNMDPTGAAVFSSLVGVTTTFLIYFVFKKALGPKEAFIGSLIWATLPERIAWNPLLIPFFASLIIFLAFKIAEGKAKFIPWAFLVFGLSLQIHFQGIFFLPPILLSIYYSKVKKSLLVKNIILGFLLLCLTFLPILFFDFRHDFLNVKGFFNLFFKGQNNQLNGSVATQFFRSSEHLLRFIHRGFFQNLFNSEAFIGFCILVLSLVGLLIAKFSKKLKLILISLIFLPPVVFVFYKGQLSEYYFTVCMIPVLFGLAILGGWVYKNRLGKLVVVISLLLLIFCKLDSLVNNKFYPDYKISSLYYKKQAVKFIVNQTKDPIFNISFTTKVNENTGFLYLFKLYGREPQNIPEGHLWTIVIPSSAADVAPIAKFGDIAIIRR